MASPKRPEQIQKKSLVELDITDLAYGGKGLGKQGNFVIFAPHTAPGDKVSVRITKRQKNFAEGIVEEVFSPSPDRITPRCPLFGKCGGCNWQHLPYETQLAHKQKQVEETLARIGSVTPEAKKPIIASPQEWRYRNKMDFTFGTNEEGQVVLGFHKPGMFWKIIDVESCLLQPEPQDAILDVTRRYAREKGLTAYNQKSHTGFLRHLILRHSVAEDAFMALLITHDGPLPDKEKFVEELKAACPNLKGFVWGINTAIADIARVEREAWRWGEPELFEELEGIRFRVSPLSFFQVNTHAATRLYSVIRDFLGEDAKNTRLLDAYCGTGSIGLFCANQVEDLVGVEIVKDAIWDARLNAERNGISNCLFLAGDMRDTLPLAKQLPGKSFGRVVMDPPRGGMDKRSLRGLIGVQAPVLIYVSCNPSTLARDVETIVNGGYRPTALQPVDLFPQTYHIEAVLRFDLDS